MPQNAGGPYLGDTIYMARAFLKLYAVTADRKWLKRAEEAAQFIDSEIQERHRLHCVRPTAGREAETEAEGR